MNDDVLHSTPDRHAWGRKFFARVQRYRNLVLRRWWVPVLCAALALGIGLAKVRLTPPSYVSVGQMIVSIKLNIKEGSLYTEELGNFLGTQAALMQGSEVQNAARNRLANQTPGLVPPKSPELQVSVLPKTTIFVLHATGKDPDYTKAYLQACMDAYIDLKKQMVEHTSDTTIAGLTDQMMKLEPEMHRVDNEMAGFLRTNDAALLSETTGVGDYLTILYQRLAEAQSEHDLLDSMSLDQNLLLEQDHSPAMINAPQAQSPTSGANLLGNAALGGSLFSPDTIGMQYLALKQQILLLKADEERYAKYLKPMHPKMVAMNEEADRLSHLLEIYKEQSVEQLAAKKDALALQITNLQNQTKQWGKENLELDRKSAEYQRLKARSDRLQALYDQLLATMETLDVSKDISPESVTVYQAATDAYVDPDRTRKSLVMAGGLGLLLGLGILFLMDRVDDRMNSFTELEELFDEDVIGQIPREKTPRKGRTLPLLQPEDTRHTFMESYRNLRSSLLYMAETGARPHTLLITSSVPNDGKSVTASNLAITLALGGARVLLVDADLRKGSLHTRFEIAADSGLSEVLTQGRDWHGAIKPTAIPTLSLLPRGAVTHRSSELFIGPVMEKFLKETIQEYDYVLIDTAPVMAADDVTSLAPRVDGVIFVVRAEFTSARVARASLDMLYQRKARVLGLIFNSVRASAGDYYNYYRYRDYYAQPPKK